VGLYKGQGAHEELLTDGSGFCQLLIKVFVDFTRQGGTRDGKEGINSFPATRLHLELGADGTFGWNWALLRKKDMW
jgi:hypothetical protein